MTDITLMTELDAVNLMLRAIGEAQVVTLDELDNLTDAGVARGVLLSKTRLFQLEGWHFNTDVEYPLQPNGNNEIVVPANVGTIDLSDIEAGRYDAVWRNGKLWDRKEKSFTVFTREVKCDITWTFPFEELPPYAREYIAVLAAMEHVEDELGSEKIDRFLRRRLAITQATFNAIENRSSDRTIFDTGTAARTVQR